MKEITSREAVLFSEGQAEDSGHFEYWRVALRKHRWSIAVLAVLIGLLAALVVFAIRPVYRATTTLLIESSKAKVVSIEEVYNAGGGANREFYLTQSEILKSRELAGRVIQRLKLLTHPEFDPRQASDAFPMSLLTLLPAAWRQPDGALSDDEVLKGAVAAFGKRLIVQPVPNSQLVLITFDSHDKALSARIPNTLADVYIESDLDARLQMTQKAGTWLTTQLGGLREKLELSERALQQYREREKIIESKGLAQSGSSKQLEDLTSALVVARQRRAEAESSYNQIAAATRGQAAGGLESIPAVLRHPLVQRLKEHEAETEKKLSELSLRFGREHPRMIAGDAELKVARENTRKQVDSVVAGITREYEVARANEQAIERALGQVKGDIQSLNRKEFQLGVLEREVAANKQLYDLFMSRFKETNVAGELQTTIARVVDAAVASSIPHSPKKLQIVGFSVVLGLLLGVLMAFFLEYLDNTLKTSEDVEPKVGLPALGILERLRKGQGKHMELAFLEDPHSTFSEAVRTIRTAVMLSGLDAPHKVLLVTSSVSAEGKTTVAANLALAIGQMKKVLLIDADMRQPRIGDIFGHGSRAGLSNLVAGTAKASDCVHSVDGSRLHVMPSGVIPPNPQELLSSKRFDEVIAKLGENFDVIVIDSPPVHLVSDALILAGHASAVIYIAKADATPFQIARDGIRRLRNVNAPLLGVVLNQVDLKRAERYYGYGGYGGGKGYPSRGYGAST